MIVNGAEMLEPAIKWGMQTAGGKEMWRKRDLITQKHRKQACPWGNSLKAARRRWRPRKG